MCTAKMKFRLWFPTLVTNLVGLLLMRAIAAKWRACVTESSRARDATVNIVE